MFEFHQERGRSTADDYTDGKARGYGSMPDPDYESPIPDLSEFDLEQDETARKICAAFKDVWDRETNIMAPILAKARVGWDAYHQLLQSGGKEEWMSDLRIPIYMIQVERMVAMMMQMIERDNGWLEVVSANPKNQLYHEIAKRRTLANLRSPATKFRTKLRHAFIDGAVTGNMSVLTTYKNRQVEVRGQNTGIEDELSMGALFSTPNDTEVPFVSPRDMPHSHMEVLSPMAVRIDSTGLERRVMWEKFVPASYLWDLGDKAGYDMSALRRAMSSLSKGNTSIESTVYFNETGYGDSDVNSDLLRVRFLEGDLEGEAGTGLLLKDKFCVFVENELVFGPVDVNWMHGSRSVIFSPFLSFGRSVFGKSPLTEAIDGFAMNMEIFNQMVDYCSQVIYGAHEVDRTRLDEDHQRTKITIAPGSVFFTEGDSGKPVIQRVQSPSPDAGWWNHFEVFKQTLENSTGMSNQLGGASRTRGRVGAKEFQSRMADGGALFKSWFEDIEVNLLAPLIRNLYINDLQFTSQEDWSAQIQSEAEAILGMAESTPPEIKQQWKQTLDQIATWSPEDRVRHLGGMYHFEVKVVSTLFDRQAKLETFTTILEVSQKAGALPLLNMPYIMSEFVRAAGEDPAKALNLKLNPTPSVDSTQTAVSNSRDRNADVEDAAGQQMFEEEETPMFSSRRKVSYPGPNPLSMIPPGGGGFSG